MPKIARLESGKIKEQVECTSGLSSNANLIRAASRIIGVEIARNAKVATPKIKEVLERAGVDFHVLIVTDPPVDPKTQLQRAVFEAVENAFG